jgi:hypothetical protein
MWGKPHYVSGLTLERKDNDGNYEPDNCVWATWRTQAHNRRNLGRKTNHLIEYNNHVLPIGEWEKRLGLTKGTLVHRLGHGWDIEKAMTTSRITHHAN